MTRANASLLPGSDHETIETLRRCIELAKWAVSRLKRCRDRSFSGLPPARGYLLNRLSKPSRYKFFPPFPTAFTGAAVGGQVGPMGTMKALWASVQGDPVFMRRVNGWFTIFWVAMIPVSIITGWITSVTYVAVLSLWALVSGHWAAWQAARVEVTQQAEQDERMADPVEQRVVDVLVESTNIEAFAHS